MNRTVCRPGGTARTWPVSITSRTSFTPALSADSWTNRRFVAEETISASVVLPVPGRAEQDQRHRRVTLDEPAQRRSGAEQVLLADDLVERARTHPGGQRRRRVERSRVSPRFVRLEQGHDMKPKRGYRLGVRKAPFVVIVATALVIGVASPASAFVETSTSDPVTAAPPVSRPDTSSCTVSLADKFYSNAPDGSQQYYSGTLAPPADCPGPWAKVVLTQTISVTGRQFDRVSSLRIGNTDVYWGTTEEPSGPTPTTYTFDKDITEYAALLRQPQPYRGGIGNYVTDVYTGNYLQPSRSPTTRRIGVTRPRQRRTR